jgi:hypothetical protein
LNKLISNEIFVLASDVIELIDFERGMRLRYKSLQQGHFGIHKKSTCFSKAPHAYTHIYIILEFLFFFQSLNLNCIKSIPQSNLEITTNHYVIYNVIIVRVKHKLFYNNSINLLD